jgi:hypothetical protein
MLLTTQQSYELLARQGCYITEACDKCGQILGPGRYTRKGDSGVWCSRECRDGKEGHAPGTCKGCGAKLPDGKRRGTLFCDDACKHAAHREKISDQKLSVTKPPIYEGFCTVSGPNGIIRNANRRRFAQS